MLFIACVLCACVLLLMPHHVTTKLQLAFSTIFQVPLGTGRILALAAQTPTPDRDITPADYNSLKRKILQLQNHIDELRAELEQERSEKERLSKVSLGRAWGPHGLVPAQVIQAVIGADQITLNQGRGDEPALAVGQYILADNAVIGTLTELTQHQAKGILITDKSSHIPVFIRADHARPKGDLFGLGNGKAKIGKVRFQEKIEIGDPVHVETQPGLLEVPIVVGRVSQCRRSEIEPLVWDITVEPASDLKSINRVDVIVAHE